MTRTEYLNSTSPDKLTQYYAQFVTADVLRAVRRMVAGRDPETIALPEWDRVAGGTGSPDGGLAHCPFPEAAARMKAAGDYYTLGGGVCLAKTAARMAAACDRENAKHLEA